MKKRVFRRFRYRSCDAMACFLEEMAGKGWGFSGWRWGMVFEREAPAAACYDVEVFPKGSEMDLRPSEAAQEYAEYCREAGWELIDSRKKFCVFRRIKEDAVPIVTPAERFQNVKSAEVREYLTRFFSQFFLTALLWGQFLTSSFLNWIFDDFMVFMMFVYLVAFIGTLAEGLALLGWLRRMKGELENGGNPFYGCKGKCRKAKYRWDVFAEGQFIFLIVLTLAAVYQAVRNGRFVVILVLATALLIIGGASILVSVLRPSREEHWAIQLGSAFLFPISVIILCLAVIAPDEARGAGSGGWPEVPLVQTDYKEITGKIFDIRREQGQSVMGSVNNSMVVYETNAGDTDTISYTVYTSNYDWVLDRIWGRQTRKAEGAEDVSASWDAEIALRSTSPVTTYTVRYHGQILVMWVTPDALDQTQIRTVREKLALP